MMPLPLMEQSTASTLQIHSKTITHLQAGLHDSEMFRLPSSGLTTSTESQGQGQPRQVSKAPLWDCEARRTLRTYSSKVFTINPFQVCQYRNSIRFVTAHTHSERERERERERARERDWTTSIQPAWLMRTDLCSCLGHLQNGCEAMANSLLVLMPYEQTHGAFSILKQIGILDVKQM